MSDEQGTNIAEEIIANQRGHYAALGALIWTCPILLVWYSIVNLVPDLSGICIVVTGAVVGLVFRTHGKGVSGAFRFAAIFVYLTILIFTTALGVTLKGPIHVAIALGLFLGGTASAGFFAKRSINRVEEAALWRHRLSENGKTAAMFNSSWVLVPLSIIASLVSGVLATALILSFMA